MGKRLTIKITVSAVLLGVLAFLFVYLYGQTSKGTKEVLIDNAVYRSVPTDAVVIYRAVNTADCMNLLESDSSPLKAYQQEKNGRLHKAVLMVQPVFAGSPMTYSLHYSSKNTLSGLCSFQTDGNVSQSEILSGIPYTPLQQGICLLDGTGIYAVLKDKVFLLCENRVVLQAALRHLDDGVSIVDIDAFRELALEYATEPQVVFINHSQIGKVFSGLGSRKSLKHASFFTTAADWTAYSLSTAPNEIRAQGEHYNALNGRYTALYRFGKVRQPDIYSFLPANTSFVVRFSTSDFQKYLNEYMTYVDINGSISRYTASQKKYLDMFKEKKKLYSRFPESEQVKVEDPRSWLNRISPKEIVLAGYRSADTLEYVTMLRTESEFDYAKLYSRTLAKDKVIEIKPFPYRGYLDMTLGDLFSSHDRSFYMKYKGWYIIGSKKYLENILNGEYEYFSLTDYLAPAALEPGNASFEVLLSLTEMQKQIVSYFNANYSAAVKTLLESGNYGFLRYAIVPEEDGDISRQKSRIDLLLCQLDKLPAPEFIPGVVPIVGDTVVTLPQGPFAIKNHVNGKTNYLKQYPNCKLQLLNEKRMGIWTIDFDTPITGYVAQIDYLKNDKLQMLFCSESSVYCLDRTGHWVQGFPLHLPKKVMMGPVVYDFDRNRDYTFMVMNADNSFSLYDLDGRLHDGWTDIKTAEKVIEMPEPLKVGDRIFWIVRSAGRMYIYDFNGNPVDENDPRYVIRRESPVQIVSDDSVLVQCLDEREYYVDLNTGKFTRKTE